MRLISVTGGELAAVDMKRPVIVPLCCQALKEASLLLGGDITDHPLFRFEVIVKLFRFELLRAILVDGQAYSLAGGIPSEGGEYRSCLHVQHNGVSCELYGSVCDSGILHKADFLRPHVSLHVTIRIIDNWLINSI